MMKSAKTSIRRPGKPLSLPAFPCWVAIFLRLNGSPLEVSKGTARTVQRSREATARRKTSVMTCNAQLQPLELTPVAWKSASNPTMAQPSGTTKRDPKTSHRPSGSRGVDLYKFINSFSPEDSKSSSHRKAVRSQAARPQHSRNSLNSPEDSRVTRKYSRSKRNVTFKIQLSVDEDGRNGNCKVEQSNDEAADDAFYEALPMPSALDGGWVEPFRSLSVSTRSNSFAPGMINHCESAIVWDEQKARESVQPQKNLPDQKVSRQLAHAEHGLCLFPYVSFSTEKRNPNFKSERHQRLMVALLLPQT